jgi:hypothetical protein
MMDWVVSGALLIFIVVVLTVLKMRQRRGR